MAEVPVFVDRYMWRIMHAIDAARMKIAAGYLLGRHDFSS